jgi:hypothetical protein
MAPENHQSEQSSLGELLPLYLSAVYSTGSSSEGAGPNSFCSDEPLCFDDVGEVTHFPDFGPTPGPFGPSPFYEPALPFYEPALPNAADEPFPTVSPSMATFSKLQGWCRRDQLGAELAGMSSSPTLLTHGQTRWLALSPWKDGKLSGMVQNTFIHAAMPPPTPMPGTLRRSSSLGDLREFSASPVNSLSMCSRHLAEAADEVRSAFCPDEPLCLDDVLCAPRPMAVNRWPALSPWKDGKLDSMVQNTFIHAALPPPTPAPGTLRRSRSTGDLAEVAASWALMWQTAADGGRAEEHACPSIPPTPAHALLVPPSPAWPASPIQPEPVDHLAHFLAQHQQWMPHLHEDAFGLAPLAPHLQPPPVVLSIADILAAN